MKKLILALTLNFTTLSFAHDGGHGPQLSDTGKFGGIVSSVVLKSDVSKGDKAALVYKAELARSQDGTVRVYVYDEKMNQLDLSTFEADGSALLAAKVKGKYKNSTFSLKKEGKSFIGKMPKPEGKPYNIDVTLKEKTRELFSAFDNLD